MKMRTSKLPLLTALLAIIQFLLPSAAVAAVVARAIGTNKNQRLELPDLLAVGLKSIAFEQGAGWTTFVYSPGYTKNSCDTFSDLP
ncbi:hypothetical protein C2845_PM10G17290 [Panicum miliaceum]|uniref:Uncharacterized protein n=1 Tax=Panicum miliaceum TaxID=4540 RepID=A0A3L6PGW1_PANMI|nr:hypothetical protein C2845_PM10G17290 [Panicum miliaceum]